MVAAAVEQGPLRALVNNAAIHWTAPIADETPASLRRIWEVNYLGTFLGIQSVADPMAEAGGGGIVNISSIAGMNGIRPTRGVWGHQVGGAGPDQGGGH